MQKRQTGFTLIELITVIVILGALAVIALPRYIDLQSEADQAATDGVAGSLAAGTAVNLAASLAGSTDATTVTTCANAPNTLSGGGLPTGYSMTTNTGDSIGANEGDTTTCNVAGPEGSTSSFTAYNAQP